MRFRTTFAAITLAGLSLTGCGAATLQPTVGMLGSDAGNGGAMSGFAAGMMGVGAMGSAPAGNHFSQWSCSAPADLPGSTVDVAVGDLRMNRMMGGAAPRDSSMMLRAAPGPVPAGDVSLVVGNMGWRSHEVVVLPLGLEDGEGERQTGPDGTVDEAGSLGEVSASCDSGAGAGITAGTVGWVTLQLAPGRYELVCNLPGHYAGGMHTVLVVE